MRLMTLGLFASLIGAPAFAQQVSPMTGTTTTTPTVAPATAPAAAHPARKTLAERFEAANTTHDGKLTLEQAKAAKMTRLVQQFDAIDTAKKGSITLDDIHAYNRAQRAARKAAK